jgi:hypothetical protein
VRVRAGLGGSGTFESDSFLAMRPNLGRSWFTDGKQMWAQLKSFLAWLKSTRDPFLNFLRNLTPQVFLMSAVWVLGAKLDFNRLFRKWVANTWLLFFLNNVLLCDLCQRNAVL